MKYYVQMPEAVTCNYSKRLLDLIGGSVGESLHHGRWCNAHVMRIELHGKYYAVKEFHSKHWIVRVTLGRWLISREYRILKRLSGLPGVPSGVQRVSRVALLMNYVPGRTLTELVKTGECVSSFFFQQVEDCVDRIHRAGYAHLDLRNLGNIILGADNTPYLIDFQSAMPIRFFPAGLRNLMKTVDYSGVYKGWKKLCDQPLDSTRLARLKTIERHRKFWVFKGYWFGKMLKRCR